MTSSSAAHPGLLLIISGPSGVGKTTITHAVEKRLDAVFSISMTTRPKTLKDEEGVDYFFVNQPQFDQARQNHELLEWAEVFGNCYGTPRRFVEDQLAQGRIVLLEIDVEGAAQVKRSLPDAFALFVLPPSEQTLLQRLRRRRREDEPAIQRRFDRARHEIDLAHTSGLYDHFIVNDNLDHAVNQAVEAVEAELQRRRNLSH